MKMSDLFSMLKFSTRRRLNSGLSLSCVRCNLFHSSKVLCALFDRPNLQQLSSHDIKPTLKSSRAIAVWSCKIFIMSWAAPTTKASRENRCESTSLGQVLSGLSRNASAGLLRATMEKFCNFSIYLKLNIHTLESETTTDWRLSCLCCFFAVCCCCDADGWTISKSAEKTMEKKRRMHCCAMIFFLLIWIISSALFFIIYIYILQSHFFAMIPTTTQAISLLFKSRENEKKKKIEPATNSLQEIERRARSSLQVSVY